MNRVACDVVLYAGRWKRNGPQTLVASVTEALKSAFSGMGRLLDARFQAVDDENGRRVLVSVDAEWSGYVSGDLDPAEICDPEDCVDAISRCLCDELQPEYESQVEVEVTALSEAG